MSEERLLCTAHTHTPLPQFRGGDVHRKTTTTTRMMCERLVYYMMKRDERKERKEREKREK